VVNRVPLLIWFVLFVAILGVATWLSWYDNDGWGWFLFLAFMLSGPQIGQCLECRKRKVLECKSSMQDLTTGTRAGKSSSELPAK